MSVTIERDGSVWTVVLDRREVRNAVDRQTAQALADAFEAFDADEQARVAVFWGAGGDFCAGADLKALARGEGNRLEPTGRGPMGPTRMELDKPVIAAVSGHAVAGGLELALWCDLRVAEESAVFGVFCRRFGVPLIDGGTVRLPRVVGQGRAMELILTGRPVQAQEALQMGLCNRVVNDGEALEEARRWAAEIAAFPQTCLRGDRRSARAQWGLCEAEALRQEFAIGQQALSDEALDGALRFTDGQGRHGSFDPA